MPKLSMPPASSPVNDSTETASPVEAAPVVTRAAGRPRKGGPLTLAGNSQLTPLAKIAGISGDIDASDIQVPGFTLVQPDSAIDRAMPGAAGNFVYEKEVSLGETVLVIVANADKKYQEDIPFDPGNPPRVFGNAQVAAESGVYALNPIAVIDLILCLPIDSEDASMGAAEDDVYSYVPCRWWVTGRNFTSVYKALCTALTLKRDTATYGRFFELNGKLAPAKGRTLYQAFLSATDDALTQSQVDIAQALGAGAATE